jgi:Tfp pilus assembly protein PilP
VGGPVAAAAPAPEPSTPALDPSGIRDVFRFADEPAPAAERARGPSASSGEEPLASASTSGLRLVGLLRRGGRTVAALAADGEVEIAGPGETAAGVTVLSVGEDRVRVRRADGREETLVLP